MMIATTQSSIYCNNISKQMLSIVCMICCFSSLFLLNHQSSSLQVDPVRLEALVDNLLLADDFTATAVVAYDKQHTDTVLLEIMNVDSGCKSDHYCPIKNGVCCEGGSYCCPPGSVCAGAQRCSRSSLENALSAAKLKMEEEGQKQLDSEAQRKKKTESGQKKAEEEKMKNLAEQDTKKKEEIAEANKKAVAQAREAALKDKEQSQEQLEKRSEETQKKQESSFKTQARVAEDKTKQAQADLEKRVAEHKEKAEKARLEKEGLQEQQQKAQEDRTKKEEEKEKARQKEESAKAEEKEKQKDIMTIRDATFRPTANHIIASNSILEYKGVFSLMFWVRPEGLNNGWSNILHKGAADNQRNPAIWFYPGQTRLHIRSGTRNDWNNGADPNGDLPMWCWTHVTVIHANREMIIYYNGTQVLRQGSLEPLANNGDLYASNPWYVPAFASIAEIIYAPRAVEEKYITARVEAKKYAPLQVKEVVLIEKFVPKPGAVIADKTRIQPNRQFTYTFWIRPRGISPHWSGIIHKGRENHFRNPAIWFYPGQTRVHFRSGTQADWNDGIDPGQHLPLHEWTHVAFAHRHGYFRVWYNGKPVVSEPRLMPYENDDSLFACGPWYVGADAIVGDLRYINVAADDEMINKIMQADKKPSVAPQMTQIFLEKRRPQRNSMVFSNSQLAQSTTWTWMFWVKPEGTRGGWSNIMHKGRQDGNRGPAIWFYPGNLRLHLRSSTEDNWNSGEDPAEQLPMQQWTHVTLSHRFGDLKVYYNGQIRARNGGGIRSPVWNDGDVWFSNPWYDNALCEVSDMRYYDENVPQDTVNQVVGEKKY